jgi:hypothetical protein
MSSDLCFGPKAPLGNVNVPIVRGDYITPNDVSKSGTKPKTEKRAIFTNPRTSMNDALNAIREEQMTDASRN